jgi:hypothetical protein
MLFLRLGIASALRPFNAIGVEHLPTELWWEAPRVAARIRSDIPANSLAPTARLRGAFHLLRY